MKIYHFTISLIVCLLTTFATWSQEFSVQTTRVGEVIYGMENKIAITSSVNCKSLLVRSDNGKITKMGECQYSLIPVRTGAVNITIGLIERGDEIIYTQTFQSIPFKYAPPSVSDRNQNEWVASTPTTNTNKPAAKPQPQGKLRAHLFGKFGGSISKSHLRNVFTLNAGYVNGFNLSSSDILSYHVSIERNNAVIYNRMNYQADFSTDLATAMTSVQKGDKIFITKIMVKEVTGIETRLGSIMFEIVD